MSEILDSINSPGDLKELSYSKLERLASEIRAMLVERASLNGGHLASNLGAVELTIALHRVFTSPKDKIVWDVGHQSYTHKLLTGRKDSFATIRQYEGLSGFPARDESPHDAFGAGHAGTSVSAALGRALARDLKGEDFHVVPVIGDGALTAGIALEAINNVGQMGTKLTVVLCDNNMAISPTVGAISTLLSQVRTDPKYEMAKGEARKFVTSMPMGGHAWAASKIMKDRLKRAIIPPAFWEDLGFVYIGPVNGHSIHEVESALKRARDFESKPTLVHVLTKKGKGYSPAEDDAVKFHGVSPPKTNKSEAPSYSEVFGQTILRLLEEDQRVVAITAAMLEGTGLAEAARQLPNRVFDVGICEQHAVTLAAGLSTQGFIPIVAIYSTFLQRAYDQIIHDVCIQNLPVVFALDRAGIVGDDGKTHQGTFDLSYLRSVPNMVVAAPKDEDELQHLLFTAVNAGRPMAVRYPRGRGEGVPMGQELKKLPLGKGEVLREGHDIAILAIGSTVYPALNAAEQLAREGVECSVINARFAKPLDEDLIVGISARTKRVLTVEENSVNGGFGSAVLELFESYNISGVKTRCIGLPDEFIEHGPQAIFRSMFGLDSEGIAKKVRTSFSELFPESCIAHSSRGNSD
ncbi:MAG: 1-deoxy-D-xylulose-5-phosphate synthase [Dehalococcoidia bacterium]